MIIFIFFKLKLIIKITLYLPNCQSAKIKKNNKKTHKKQKFFLQFWQKESRS